jgi:hypothetical protein
MTKTSVLIAALLIGVTACGGDTESSDEGGAGDQPTATQTAATQETAGDSGGNTPADPDEGADDSGDAEGSGPSTATVTLGGATYAFSTEGAVAAQCLTDLFGIFSVQLPMIDGDGSIKILILHDDTDPAEVDEVNAVAISIDDEDWEADEATELFDMSDALQPGMTQVDSAEIDGRTVRGTATFVRQNSVFGGALETMTGTFEATCGEERVA